MGRPGDPTEHHNVAHVYPEKVAEMLNRMDEIKQTAVLPVRCMCEGGPCDDGYGGVACSVTNKTDNAEGYKLSKEYASPAACGIAQGEYQGFWVSTQPPPPSPFDPVGCL